MLSRYYIQCEIGTRLEDWPDERFWQEFKARCPKEMADQIVTGPSIEKSIAPFRRGADALWTSVPGRGCGAHRAAGRREGLESGGVRRFLSVARSGGTYRTSKTHYLDCYSDKALRRVWSAARLSWWLTLLLHRFPDETPFDMRTRENQFDYLAASEHAQASFAEQYVGMPFES